MKPFRIPKSIEELADWYIRYVSPIGLIAGVISDNLILLRRVDLWTSNALLFFYLVAAATCIILLNCIELGRLRQQLFLNMLPLVPVVAQFAFGGLFSAFVSLYSRSAAYSWSWIFVVAVGLLLIGNERFVHFYRRFSFQMSIYFTVLFSFLIFFFPVVFGQIGPSMFLLSGAVALVIVAVFASVLFFYLPERRTQAFALGRSIAIIYVVFNILYFTGAIPPLPLALKDAGVLHSVQRSADGYLVSYEPVPWYESFLRYNTVFHHAPGETVYVWSAIFAPSSLAITVYHEWQHFDETSNSWVTLQTVQYPIQGGRDGGFRGYSARPDPEAGAWRVNVVTSYGQIIGRISFSIVDVATSTPTEQDVR